MRPFLGLLGFLKKAIFGADIILGMVIYLVFSWIFGQKFNIYYLCLSIGSTHLPDIDVVPFLVLKILKKHHKWKPHWAIGHHPVFIIPGFSILAYYLAYRFGYNSFYIASIVGTGVVLHLMHDSMDPTGFHWFSPFSWKHIQLNAKVKKYFLQIKWPLLRPRSEELVKRFHKRWAWKTRKYNVFQQIAALAVKVTMPHYVSFAISFVGILAFALQ